MLEKIKHTENLHVFLWILKDSCWMMDLRVPGTIMIFPTLSVAFYIVWISREDLSLFLPNLAVGFWISANASWMMFDFYQWHTKPVAITLFILGLISTGIYFINYFFKKNKSASITDIDELS